MDTKTKIVELIRELTNAANIAAQLNINLSYNESLGGDMLDSTKVEILVLDAQYIRRSIEKLNLKVIDNAPEF